MSRHSGPQRPGADRATRRERRIAAEARDEAIDPERRRRVQLSESERDCE